MSAAEIQRLAKFFSNYFSEILHLIEVTQLPTYPVMTGKFF